jgi:hypothetical protein
MCSNHIFATSKKELFTKTVLFLCILIKIMEKVEKNFL